MLYNVCTESKCSQEATNCYHKPQMFLAGFKQHGTCFWQQNTDAGSHNNNGRCRKYMYEVNNSEFHRTSYSKSGDESPTGNVSKVTFKELPGILNMIFYD